VELFADRFIVMDVDAKRSEAPTAIGPPGQAVQRAIDVSSREPITLVHSSAGGPSEQLQWSLRCGRFASIYHPYIATLVDFGLIGEGRRFEAWRGVDTWRGDPYAADCARGHVATYLGASDLTPCGPHARVVQWSGRAVVIPDATAGHELSATSTGPTDQPALATCGLESIGRSAVAAVAELLSEPTRCPPRSHCGVRPAADAMSPRARSRAVPA
jgi:hypothetical protein